MTGDHTVTVLEEHVVGCAVCRAEGAPPAVTMAFQPIVDVARGRVVGHEALVRGPAGEPAATVLGAVTSDTRFRFDQRCRVRAIQQAAELGLPDDQLLSINFLPNAVYEPATCIRTTLAAATTYGIPHTSLVFELTEVEQVTDAGKLTAIVEEYRSRGLRTAIDDFGSGHNGLNLLADFVPDIVKLDMHLVRGVAQDRRRQTLVASTVALCDELGISVIGEGVETAEEALALADLGVGGQQGYWYARPAFDALATVPSDRLAVGGRPSAA